MNATGLWRGNKATPRQQRLAFGKSTRQGKATQAMALLALLRQARANNKAVELAIIMALGIAQHGARFNELRSLGFVIENELDRDSRGIVRSRYWLRYDPERDGANGK